MAMMSFGICGLAETTVAINLNLIEETSREQRADRTVNQAGVRFPLRSDGLHA
jgi:hypothetical protein